MKTIVIQSHGMGVESQAILERWIAEPGCRPFESWGQLIVVTAQVGEEHKNDTIRDMESRALPMMRQLGIRFVELARRGAFEEDGIVVLQDTRSPEKLHPDGAYKLSDELLRSGTVPQFGGEHRCAMKFKAFVIETWLAWEFHGEQAAPVHHVFGYNAGELSRISKSDMHIERHNEERMIDAPKTPLMVFGFNSLEIGRIERAKKYDGPSRTGSYPLQEWGWDRQKCIDYIKERSDITWKKSHCSFCPFCGEAAKGEAAAVERWKAAPEQTAHGLLVEYNSMCFNPRGHLYRDRALIDVIRKHDVQPVIKAFEERLAKMDWCIYRVRRIYTKKGKAIRCVEKRRTGPRMEMENVLDGLSTGATKTDLGKAYSFNPVITRGIKYWMFRERKPDAYPALEGFYVAAPAFMETKLRGPVGKFNERWDRVEAGLPMNPGKEDEQDD